MAELDLFQITDPDPTKGPESGHIWIQPNHPDPYTTYELVRMEIEEILRSNRYSIMEEL